MTCKEAVYSEEVLDYIVGIYRGENYILTLYNPICYMTYDNLQGVIYQKPGQITSETIEKYGYSAIPNVYGLMSEEALEESGVLRIRRQPYLDLYGQGVLIGFVDTGDGVIILPLAIKLFIDFLFLLCYTIYQIRRV